MRGWGRGAAGDAGGSRTGLARRLSHEAPLLREVCAGTESPPPGPSRGGCTKVSGRSAQCASFQKAKLFFFEEGEEEEFSDTFPFRCRYGEVFQHWHVRMLNGFADKGPALPEPKT